MKIGLLGGSFNPAHHGHLYISEQAIKRLGLDQLWWMVSPQNPLKPTKDMAPFAERFLSAQKMAKHPKIRVTGIEKQFGTTYTYDTLRRLKMRFPGHRFILIIGADIFAELPKWQHWRDIFKEIPIAVFDRARFFPRVMAANPAVYFRNYRKILSNSSTPAWNFIAIGKKAISSTIIRKNSRESLTKP